MVEEGLVVKLKGDPGNLESAMKRGEAAIQKVGKSASAASSSLNTIGGAAQKSTRDFTGLSRIIQDLPFGFLGIQNNITQLLPAAGGLGLAISAITSAITFSQIGFGNWTRGLEDATGKAAKAKQTIQEFARSLGEIKIDIAGDVAGQTDAEIAKVSVLSKVVLDTAQSYTKRNEALRELQSINKNYFGDLTLESSKLQELTGRVNEYINALTAAAVVKAFQEEIGKVGKELSSAQEEARQTSKAIRELEGIFKGDGTVRQDLVLLSPEKSAEVVKLNDKLKEQNGVVNKLSATYKTLQKQIEAAILDTLQFKPLEVKGPEVKKSGAKEQFNFFDKFFDVKPDPARIDKQMHDMAETARDFAVKNFRLLEGLGDILSATTEKGAVDAGKKFWDNYQKGLIKFKLPPIKPVIPVEPIFQPLNQADFSFLRSIALGSEAERFGEKFSNDLAKVLTPDKDTILDNFSLEFAKINSQLPRAIERANASTGLKETVPINIEFNTTNLTKGLQAELDKQKQKIQKFHEGIQDAFNSAFADVKISGLTSLGDAIGQALSGGDIQNVFSGFANQLGGIIQQLGKQLIELGVLGQAVQGAVANLLTNPFAAIAAGIGLTALGAAIKNLSVPKFADGGIAFGPTLGVMGEYANARSNPEVIAPLSKLRGMLADTGGNTGELRIRGNDLVLATARTNRSQRRGG